MLTDLDNNEPASAIHAINPIHLLYRLLNYVLLNRKAVSYL